MESLHKDNELLIDDLESSLILFPSAHDRRTIRWKEIAHWIIKYIYRNPSQPLSGVLRQDAEYIIDRFLGRLRESTAHPIKTDLSFGGIVYGDD